MTRDEEGPAAILERHGLVPRKRWGQNFLHDRAVAQRIVDAAGISPGDRVLEIGPGLGALTGPLLDAGAVVTAVELDRGIAACLTDRLGGREGLEIIVADVLRVDPARLPNDPVRLVANLPYSITGPILSMILTSPDRFHSAVLMVQREVARRLVAGSGGREIGAPAVLLRLLYRVKKQFDVGTGAFFPAPGVVSTVLSLERIAGSRLSPAVADAVNRAYRQRRKMIRKTLKDTVAAEGELVRRLRGLGRSEEARPEELEPEDWPELVDSGPKEERA
ncbi:MAG: 16S rRNA (adenine(1518)-N(6)/adenine(1519)-N(6))-dimethyltransferase RsmA [Gemmatimonadota bacterium]|jgi:16S rRNA (adenine1518-N6/adenine1519-N6)-dimethyltransferase|nr:16S rRNA (adenine(1518)-N(6)/adenine(1519)-N(6))-dimethyltransferase RsmA [Gemmatimonadota bacterium]